MLQHSTHAQLTKLVVSPVSGVGSTGRSCGRGQIRLIKLAVGVVVPLVSDGPGLAPELVAERLRVAP